VTSVERRPIERASGELRPAGQAVSSQLPLPCLLLAIGVVAVWGTNFVVIRLGLDRMPPLLFATLRFVFALLPAVFFLKRPPVTWGNLAAYGFLGGVGQFGLLFLAMKGHISPGLASLVIQIQVFFTVALSVLIAKERVRGFQVVALGLGAAGIAVIMVHTDLATTPLGLALVLAAALCWAAANLLVKRSGAPNMLAYVVWASLFSVPPLFLLSLLAEGWPAILRGLTQSGWTAWVAVLWQSLGNTLFGFAVWGWLLARFPAATVTPLALLVPVFGMAASTLWLSEPMPGWKIAAAAFVLGGLAVSTLYPRWRRLWA
jgi:O-acetylserine/cysteine efflux transporter